MRMPSCASTVLCAHHGMKNRGRSKRPQSHSNTHSTTPPPTGRKNYLIRPIKSLTTLRMQTHTPHANLTKTAIGYVRVSTQEQATEGVSLDAQRDRLRACCKVKRH